MRELSERPYIDADRVGIHGHSYGGFMSALAIVKHPDVFQVSVASSPVTDWRNYDSIYTERYMRTPQENAKGYDDCAAMTFLLRHPAAPIVCCGPILPQASSPGMF